MKSAARSFLALLLTTAMSAALPQAVLAADVANCSEYYYVNRQVGYTSDQWANHRFGVRAVLDNQSLHICTNPRRGEAGGNFALINLEGPPGAASVFDIVQWGIGNCIAPNSECVGATRDIWAYGRTQTSPGCSAYPDVAPTVHVRNEFSGGYTYQITATSSGGYNLSVYGTTKVSIAPICWTANYITVFGESWDYGDAIGGTASDHFNFTSAQAQYSLNSTWSNLPVSCNFRDPGLEGIFKCDHPANYKIGIWTDR